MGSYGPLGAGGQRRVGGKEGQSKKYSLEMPLDETQADLPAVTK